MIETKQQHWFNKTHTNTFLFFKIKQSLCKTTQCKQLYVNWFKRLYAVKNLLWSVSSTMCRL